MTNLTSLTKLSLAGNRLNGSISADFVAALQRITQMDGRAPLRFLHDALMHARHHYAPDMHELVRSV